MTDDFNFLCKFKREERLNARCKDFKEMGKIDFRPMEAQTNFYQEKNDGIEHCTQRQERRLSDRQEETSGELEGIY